MKDKQRVHILSHWDNDELRFTEEDRKMVFEKIREQENDRKKATRRRHILPVALSVVMAALFFVFAVPAIISLNQGAEVTRDSAAKQSATIQPEDYVTSLIAFKNNNERSTVNLVASYHPGKKKAKVMALPRSTKVALKKSNGQEEQGKLLSSYAWNQMSGLTYSVENLINMEIDYQFVASEERFKEVTMEKGGIEVHIPASITISDWSGQKEIQVDRGTQRISGYRIMNLLSTDSSRSGNVSKAIASSIKGLQQEVTLQDLKQIAVEEETNMPDSTIVNSLGQIEVEVLPVNDGKQIIEEDTGVYYYIITEEDLEQYKHELTTFE
ncbi:LCP family protein [Pontibacillus salicampi]|uniref:LCP family protein n=1 Tax=Pontibacillus salicampi TaxID=1449801 RepID=A0ABV6LS59_9BACI